MKKICFIIMIVFFAFGCVSTTGGKKSQVEATQQKITQIKAEFELLHFLFTMGAAASTGEADKVEQAEMGIRLMDLVNQSEDPMLRELFNTAILSKISGDETQQQSLDFFLYLLEILSEDMEELEDLLARQYGRGKTPATSL